MFLEVDLQIILSIADEKAEEHLHHSSFDPASD